MRNYTKYKMFVATPLQAAFLTLYAQKTKQTESQVVRNYIEHIMQKNPNLTKKAEEALKEGKVI